MRKKLHVTYQSKGKRPSAATLVCACVCECAARSRGRFSEECDEKSWKSDGPVK